VQELGKTVGSASTDVKSSQKLSPDELEEKVSAIFAPSADPSSQASTWANMKQEGLVTAFGSANLRTFPVSLKMLEDRTGLTPASLGFDESNDAVSLEDFKVATVFVTLGSGCVI
jgi:hypothetical protein